MSVDFCGIELAHPIVNGSGTFDAIAARRAFGDALLEAPARTDAGWSGFPFAAFVSKTVTLAPRQGNPPPRLWELPAGMINSIGLPNKGLDGYMAEDLPKLAELPVPLIVNVMGFSREEVAQLVAAFADAEGVAALELNVSCPNVKTGMIMGADPGETAALLDAVRPLTGKPLIVKLTPNCTAPADVAAAAEAHGADAVSLINTLRGTAMHPQARPGPPRPWLGGGTGGVSGPAVRAMALAAVSEVAARVSLPIIGMGGVQHGRHAGDLRAAGATLVAVGTESFRDPLAGARVASELAGLEGAADAPPAAVPEPAAGHRAP
jgi:dihydroorotate dehydrogenase (NAD+) catalytic subunit